MCWNRKTTGLCCGVWRPWFRATLEEQRSGSQHHWTKPNHRGFPGLLTLPQAVHCRLANMEIKKKSVSVWAHHFRRSVVLRILMQNKFILKTVHTLREKRFSHTLKLKSVARPRSRTKMPSLLMKAWKDCFFTPNQVTCHKNMVGFVRGCFQVVPSCISIDYCSVSDDKPVETFLGCFYCFLNNQN